MRRLGLDLGTNSIGWCLIEDDVRIIDLGVRIFPDGRDPKSKASLAVERRLARGMRRRRDRYLGRRSAFLTTLIASGLMPADADDAKLIAEYDPYPLRARALDEKLTPHEIGRVLFHLNQRRGFKSNRKAERQQTNSEQGLISLGAEKLDFEMSKMGARTLGEFLNSRATKRVRIGSESQAYDFYPQRRHIEAEFDAICDAQASFHPHLLTEKTRTALHRILFFQRPLKEQEVGYCTFAGINFIPADERRLPKAHPLFQLRRLYEEVNQLRIISPGAPDRLLTKDQRDMLIIKLKGKKKVSFATLGKFIKLGDGERFNKESENRKDLAGDEVWAELADKKCFGSRWSQFSLDEQWRIIKKIRDEEAPEALHGWLTSNYALDDSTAKTIASISLPEGYGRFGETATRFLLDALRSDVITYAQATKQAGFHHSDRRTGEFLPYLPYYGEILAQDIAPGSEKYGDERERHFGKVTNPTVHIGLRQLEKLVNTIIDRYGRPDQIVVELARELKLNGKEREDHKRRIKKDTDAAQARALKLKDFGIADTGSNRALLRCWEELNPDNPLDRRCPYCAAPVSIKQLFSDEVDIDHIIPYSRSLDDSADNKVVAHRSCNRVKGNATPYEKWGHDEAQWELISSQVARMKKSKQWRFGPDAMVKINKDGGFLARQLTDTQYLSRLAYRYLCSLYASSDDGSAYVIPGRMTAMLRRLWGLNSLLPDHNYVDNAQSNAPKNRLDHRHHAIDAAVTAVTTRALLSRIAHTAGQTEDKNLDRLFENLEQPWPGFREELGQRLENVVTSYKPDHGRRHPPSPHRDSTAGRLHNETAYGLTGKVTDNGKTPIVVHRVPFTSLRRQDILDLPDEALRNALTVATKGLDGKEFSASLAKFTKDHPIFKGIRHVRIREPLTVIPIRDKNGLIYKAYKGDSNERWQFWRLPDGSLKSEVITMFEAHRRHHQDARPHPAAKKLLCLRQNDLIAIERNGGPREILVVKGFNVSGQLTLAPANESGNLHDRDRKPNDQDPFKYIYLSGRSVITSKARQIRIDPTGRIFDPGPRL